MRNDTPQVETREIADSDLDTISGGALGDVLQSAESALPTLPALPGVALPGITGGAGIQVTGPVSLGASLSGAAGA